MPILRIQHTVPTQSRSMDHGNRRIEISLMRARVFAVAAIIFPMALGAQQRPAGSEPPPTNRVAQTFRGFGRPYGSWLLAAFDSIPANKYNFKPTAVQQSVGYIAQHLEDANYRLCSRFGKEQHAMTAKDLLADTVKAKWPKDTLIARLKASLVFCNDVIAKLNDANLSEEVTIGPPDAKQTAVRARYLILFVTDLAEHYSQISSYMRIMGMVPPSALPPPGR